MTLPTIFFVLVLGVAVVVVIAATVGERKRREALALALNDLHLDAVTKPGKPEKAAAFEPFRHLEDRLRHGEKGVRWSVAGQVEGAHVRAIEHAYTVSTGKSSTTYYNTAAAVEAPAGWPMLHLSEEHLFHKLGGLLGMKDMQLDNEAFNKRWQIKCDDENFALLVLSPEAQAWLVNAPNREWWAIGRGGVVCGRSTRLKPDEIGAFLKRAGALRGMIPSELDAWEAPAPQA